MSPPWEKYADPANTGPWAKYATPSKPSELSYDPAGDGTQDWTPRQFTTGEKVGRVVGAAAQGASDALYGAALAPLDISGWAAKKLGLVSPDAEAPSRQVTNFLASIPGKLGITSADGPTRVEPASRAEKIAQGAGEGVGNALSIIAPAGVVANTARAGTATQGVAQTLATQPVMQTIAGGVGGAVTGATDNPWLGLAASAAVPVAASVGRGIVSPVTPQLTPQEQRLVAAAQREGIPLTPAQQTGSRSLRGAEETMARMPLSNTPMQNAFREQRQQFNRAALGRAGVNATDVSTDTLDRAFTTIGREFDNLAQQTTLNVDRQFAQDVQAAYTDYGRRLPTDIAPVFQSYMNDLAPALQAAAAGQNPQISGEVYQTIRSDIGRRLRRAGNDPDLQGALGSLQTALDDAVERSTSGPLRTAWQEARRQYQALMTIDKAAGAGTQASRSAADIPYGGLTQAVRSADPRGFARGRGQLNELARIGDYLADKVPNSGTPERMAWQNILTGGGLFTAGAASGVGIPAAIAGAASPWAISRFYNSPAGRAYLTNQLAGQTNFNALYGGLAAQQALEEAQGGQNALSRRGAP